MHPRSRKESLALSRIVGGRKLRDSRNNFVAATGFLFIVALYCLFALRVHADRFSLQAVRWAARNGLREGGPPSPEAKKLESRQSDTHGKTYSYWYLRRHGSVFVTRNFTPRASKGEMDMVGYDGNTPAFVEGRIRTVREEMSAFAELSVTPGKQHWLAPHSIF
jgi:Holliday junction resolvase-like predicted endonuclease